MFKIYILYINKNILAKIIAFELTIKKYFWYKKSMKIFWAIIFIFFVATPSLAHGYSDGHILSATIQKNRIRGDVAVYNLSNGKLHTADCEWAEKCTKNCIYMKKEDLREMFYIPCLVCGGGIIAPVVSNH